MNLLRILSMSAVAASLIGCSAFLAPTITPGTASNDVRAKLGAPSDERTLEGGLRAWDYVHGPQGFTTWRVSFDGANRVTKVEQLLTEAAFEGLRKAEFDKTSATNRLGRPMQVSVYPNLREDVWTYRYMDGTFFKLADVFFDAGSGKLKGVATYLDPAYYASTDN